MNDPQFEVGQKHYENAGFPPESPPRKQRGCFFYGCIIALILGLIGLILAGIVAYLGYTSIIKLRDEYTSTTPAEIPKADLPEDQRKALDERVAEFKKANDDGTAYELILTADEINALINENEDFKGKAYITLKGDQVSGKLSMPLGELGIPGLKGRFLNGTASLKPSIKDGQLDVRVMDLVVNDKPLPANIKTSLANENIAKDFSKNPENATMLNKIDSFEIKDDKVYIKTKAKVADTPKTDDPSKSEDSAKSKDEVKPEETPKAEPEPKESAPSKEEAKPKETEAPKKAA